MLIALVALATVVAAVAITPAMFAGLALDARRVVLVFATRAAMLGAVALLALVPALLAASVIALVRKQRVLAVRSLIVAVVVVLVLTCAELGASAWSAASVARQQPMPAKRARSNDGTDRLVVVGSSTALGFPYNPKVSVGQIVAWQLEKARPDRRVRCEILADLGLTIQGAVLRLSMLAQPPDILIIVCGSTEFSARFKPERRVDFEEAPRSGWMRSLYEASLHSALFRGLYRALRPHWESERWGEPIRPAAVDMPWLTPSEKADVLDGFERDLRWVLEYAKVNHCQTVLLLPPSNEADLEPNRSTLVPSRGEAERADATKRLGDAQNTESSNPDKSLGQLQALVRDYPEFAEGHYRLARILEARGDLDGARRHYQRACDLDAMPTRFNSELRDICTEAARSYSFVRIVDGREALLAASPRASIGDGLMLDGPHPSVRGTLVLAREVLSALDMPAQKIALPDVIAEFKIDQQTWIRAARWGHDYYAMWAPVRFDPAERRRKSQEFADVADAIAGGASIDSIGFPPMSIAAPAGQ